ncbi:putativetwo-component sensor, near polyamine transporter [Moritella sp. JT01]|uniref:GAF domain-containing sensor histidine kinase n=1 Tax=Moritella sp. JT01 TaxID=756698 RepID=UPI00079AA06E|nr:ATP-binding protein [Moritella sp. JT01]KXO07430.1 putativetwo-component sensor, near polyamine transporter [Moritella sp. JT01]
MRELPNINETDLSIEQFTFEVSNWLLENDTVDLLTAIESSLTTFLPYIQVQRMSLVRLTPDNSFEGALAVAAPGYKPVALPAQGLYSPYLEQISKGELIIAEGNLLDIINHDELVLKKMEGIISHIVVPFRVRGRIWGGITASRYIEPVHWHEDTITGIRSFGQILACTYERYAYWEKLQHKNEKLELLSHHLMDSQETERRMLSRELHDNFSQRMALLTIKASSLSQTLIVDSDKQSANALHHEIQGLAKDMQALSRSLHPAILEDLGLITALKAECRRISTIKDIDIQTLFDPIPTLNKELSLNLYRILQEALNNVTKHAQASAVFVLIQHNEDNLHFQIIDDGIGCNLDLNQTRGSIGLISIQERAQLFNGTAAFTSPEDGGFIVDIMIPTLKEYYE